MTKRRFAAVLAACVMVAMLLPAAVLATADPAAGVQASWSVTQPDATVRTDDAIAIGDDLHLEFGAVDGEPMTSCLIWLMARGGQAMLSPGNVEAGVCTMTVRLPDFPDPAARSWIPADDVALDLCVFPLQMVFADGQTRTLREADHLQPAGRGCNDGGGLSTFNAKLDFKVEPGGTSRPFVSEPPMVSWNPADWGTDMQPLAFGSPWHYELPDFVETCWPYINGEWVTVIRSENLAGCQPWNVRVPGVLPSTIAWGGEAGTWGWELVTTYRAQEFGPDGQTISAQRTPIASSDLVFESDRKSVFPVDLATTRFVTVGEPWTPVFQVTGGLPAACSMTVYTVPTGWPEVPMIEDRYAGTLDAEARCSFSIPAMVADEYHQYYVNLSWIEGVYDGDETFGGSISTIPVPEPPVIDPPVEEPGGDTGIGVDPGAGNGLLVDLEVTPDTGSLAAASGVTPACEDRAISPNLASGGSIPRLDALCDLAPGDYIAKATMIDASGRASTSTRAFTVLVPPPVVASRSPAAYAKGVARNIQPSVTFDQAVTGVSALTVRLRDVETGAWIPASVAFDPATRRATLRPNALLGAGRSYRLYVLAGVKNFDGRAAVATSASFRVSTDGTAPTFTRTPGSGATGVGRTANVVLTFSETVRGVAAKKFSLRDAVTGATVPGVVTWNSATRTVTVNPSITLGGARRYTVAVIYGITDAAGNPLAPTTWSFTTAP